MKKRIQLLILMAVLLTASQGFPQGFDYAIEGERTSEQEVLLSLVVKALGSPLRDSAEMAQAISAEGIQEYKEEGWLAPRSFFLGSQNDEVLPYEYFHDGQKYVRDITVVLCQMTDDKDPFGGEEYRQAAVEFMEKKVEQGCVQFFRVVDCFDGHWETNYGAHGIISYCPASEEKPVPFPKNVFENITDITIFDLLGRPVSLGLQDFDVSTFNIGAIQAAILQRTSEESGIFIVKVEYRGDTPQTIKVWIERGLH